MKHFRRNAAAVVFNKDKKVLMCQRTTEASKDLWQFPQGGIEDNETPALAAERELHEETGLCSVKRIMTLEQPIRYFYPQETLEKFKAIGRDHAGQDQYWSLFYFFGDDSEINLGDDEAEFRDYEWVHLTEPEQRVWPPKIESYKTAMAAFIPVIQAYKV